jgi:phosphonate transport system substrate-binding protein
MATYWNPILVYVSGKSGVRLNLQLGRTSAETTAAVVAGESDFAFTNHLFSPERAKLGWKVFGRRNAPPVSGQIVVRAMSPIKTLADLEGKTVAFPGLEAFAAYKVTFAQLSTKNINATAVFAGNIDAAISQMLAGRADAAGANSQMVAEYAVREDRMFRVLWSSPPFNDLALMASPRVPPAKVRAVAKAFLGMHKDPVGQRVLEAAANSIQTKTPISFIAASDADYAAYRDFYRASSPHPTSTGRCRPCSPTAALTRRCWSLKSRSRA